ncbi:MAG TPA: thiamine pyrophosphate-dependent enzyme [Gemmatimonadaceae bacterium]
MPADRASSPPRPPPPHFHFIHLRRESPLHLNTDAPHNVPWPDRIHDVFIRAQIRQVAYVPDAGHARLISLCRDDTSIRDIALTTEEEGVALAAGAWLGGERSALLMQSSGVGNCVNMLVMTRTCGLPLLMLVTMRGEFEEFDPWQVPMGTSAEAVLQLSGLEVHRVNDAADVERVVESAAERAFTGDDEDDDRNFYLWGGMGGAAMIGLGLALAQPHRRVLVITGDGEMLMGLGSLATIALQRPRNLTIIVLNARRADGSRVRENSYCGGRGAARAAGAEWYKAQGTVSGGDWGGRPVMEFGGATEAHPAVRC